MKKVPTIVLTGGGSGGHITPLLSLAHALKEASKGSRVIYIGLRGETLKNGLKERFAVFDEVYYVPAGKFRRYHGESLMAHLIDIKTVALNIRDFFRVLGGIGYARKILKRVKPDVVLSKGGFVAVPVGLAASILRIPIVTHDSDVIPGLANRIVGRFAILHATGMPAKNYGYPDESIRYVGIPLDERIKPVTPRMQTDFKKKLGLPPDSLVLLVGGAGLGARDVNYKAVAIAPELLKKFSKLQILHISGQAHENVLKAAYKQALRSEMERVSIIGFTSEFYKYTGAADVVISRSGATTIAELATQKKATILIPAPHLTGGHQLKNTQELAKGGAVLTLPNDAEPDELGKMAAGLLENGTKRQLLADKLSKFAKTDAADRLAELLLDAAGRK